MTAYQKRKAIFALQGLSLIELLVAIVMGLVLIGGVVTVFVANKQTYRFQDALARLQENGRYVLNRMERDIRMADTGGCPNLRIAANTVELDNTSCPNSSLSPLSNGQSMDSTTSIAAQVISPIGLSSPTIGQM